MGVAGGGCVIVGVGENGVNLWKRWIFASFFQGGCTGRVPDMYD